jgi:hypothetical protein
MRCLYCGKELALLKRWTGGGEFCSDAHRQRYQEEYNQLALNRLLQAKPLEPKPPEAKPASKPGESKQAPPQPVAEPVKAAQPAAKASPPPVKTFTPPPPMEEPKPAPQAIEREVETYSAPPAPEPMAVEAQGEPAPAEASFLVEMPVAAEPGVAAVAASETDFERSHVPVLPSLATDAWGSALAAAGQVAFQPSIRVLDYAARLSESRLEVRDFVRTAPMVEFGMAVAGETGIVETSEEPMDILIFPQPPQESPPVWTEPETEFAFETELGPLARAIFRTTGLEDSENGEVSVPVEAAPAFEAPAPEPAALKPPPAAPATPAKPAAREFARPAAPVVASTPSPSISTALRPPVAKPAPPAPPAVIAEKKADPVPERAVKPLPVTLHGIAAGRGKPVQVFPAVSGGVDLQVPRSNAMPLRPVMTLGPALPKEVTAKEAREERKPAERTVMVKPDPKKQQRPDPRFSNGKMRKPEPEKAEPEKKSAGVAAAVKEPEPARRAEAAVKQPEPAPKKTETVREAPQQSTPAPPPAKPYNQPDLGLPSLSLEASGSFWTRLPPAGKAGAGLAVALAIGGILFALSRGGNGTAASTGPHVVEGPALTGPAMDSGWITDWGAEAGVRKEHDISVLRPSLNLADYRIEFEAQIETKAIGWVYRAKDGKNYYVNKLEIVKPGLQPTVALVRFAVINGEEQPRAQFPLTMASHLDTMYKIRFDAVGDRFTTYVQDQKVDEWTDDRLKMGGIGLFSERGERMSLKGTVNVIPLVIKR